MPRITFLHPDLGIGGAERLVVDAALGLKKHGNIVNIVTTHHDRNRAFQETLNGEIPVIVVGNWIPRSIFNRFYALMAYIRMIYAALYVIGFSNLNPDVVFCDVVSVAVPVLKLKVKNVIFYCHYPDQLLSQTSGFIKIMYRFPLDWLEEVSMRKASHIFVNSKFTANVFRKTFKSLEVELNVLYPSLNMDFFDSFADCPLPSPVDDIIKTDTVCFLSINRYERKKNLNLALEAFSKLRNFVSNNEWNNLHLIVAGGYDSRLSENVEYLKELKATAKDLEITQKVSFLKSINDSEKISLLKMCTCLLYTPSNEHFGIVPIEAMYLGKPVIAVNSGGPTETVVHAETGYLCEPTSNSFVDAMKEILSDKTLSRRLGIAGRKRVSAIFSFSKFAQKLDKTVNGLLIKEKQ